MDRSPKSVIALDVGTKRIGVALANLEARFARPLTTLEHTEDVVSDIFHLCDEYDAALIVIGLPRGLDGQETEQTRSTQAFGAHLEANLAIPVYWIDEAVTSAQAEAELRDRGKPYSKGDIDALAATYILEDFIKEHPEHLHD